MAEANVAGSTLESPPLISFWQPVVMMFTTLERVWLLQGATEQMFPAHVLMGPTTDELLVAMGRREVGLRQLLAPESATIPASAVVHCVERPVIL